MKLRDEELQRSERRGGEERDKTMSDLIDRDKTLEAIQKHFNPSGEEIQDRAVAETLIGVGVVISTMPSVDIDLSGYSDRLWKNAHERGKQDAMAEIVHCKDCKHYGSADKRRFYRGMDCLNKHIDTIVPDVDFCSKAERRR